MTPLMAIHKIERLIFTFYPAAKSVTTVQFPHKNRFLPHANCTMSLVFCISPALSGRKKMRQKKPDFEQSTFGGKKVFKAK
jgi:hypothetical protein